MFRTDVRLSLAKIVGQTNETTPYNAVAAVAGENSLITEIAKNEKDPIPVDTRAAAAIEKIKKKKPLKICSIFLLVKEKPF